MTILVPALVALRSEFNTYAPKRDKTSDGWIGDPRHAASLSDHNPDETGRTSVKDADKVNEVHAIDVDRDLGPGKSMTACVKTVVTRHRQGEDDRLQYVIFDGTIWSASWDWTARRYTGSNPHDHHAHFSCRYTDKAEKDTRPWGLLVEAARPKKPPAGGHKPGSRTLRKGMTGPDVAFVRRWLGLSDTQVFDQALDAKVRRYQTMRNISVDGAVGKQTWGQMGVKVTY